jgi:hypothetical protein
VAACYLPSQVADPDEAVEIARECPLLEINRVSIEVRPAVESLAIATS